MSLSHAEAERIRRILAENHFHNLDIGSFNDVENVDIFVISMPKTGTTSLQFGFEGIGRKVIHAHNNPTTYAAFSNGDVLEKSGIGLEEVAGLRVLNPDRPVYFFFGVREEVGWYLSMAGQFRVKLNDQLRDGIVENISGVYPWSRYRFEESLAVVEKLTGISLFAQSFDADKGYSVVTRGHINLVLYRADRMLALESFIRARVDDGFRMKRERTNDDPEYIEYVSRFRLDEATLKSVYDNEVHRFFFTEADTSRLMTRYRIES